MSVFPFPINHQTIWRRPTPATLIELVVEEKITVKQALSAVRARRGVDALEVAKEALQAVINLSSWEEQESLGRRVWPLIQLDPSL